MIVWPLNLLGLSKMENFTVFPACYGFPQKISRPASRDSFFPSLARLNRLPEAKRKCWSLSSPYEHRIGQALATLSNLALGMPAKVQDTVQGGLHQEKRGWVVDVLKPKTFRPNVRGETWELWSGERVVVLKTLKSGFIEVVNGQDTIQAIQERQFRVRVEPPVPPSV